MAEFLGDGGILDDPMVYFENVAPPTWEASEISASGASPGVSDNLGTNLLEHRRLARLIFLKL